MFNKKITRHANRQVWTIQKEKISIKTVPEKDLLADILDKEIKTIVLKVSKELREYVGNIKKTMCEQNGNLNKEKNLRRNQKKMLELKSTITDNENFTRGIQRQI